MQRLIITSVIVGLISGLLVGGFHNIFTVPVIERAIAMEEVKAAAESGGAAGEEEEPLVSLGVQRIGMVVGTGIYGAVMGLLFAGGYALLRRVAPHWQPLALALVVGALGFWALSLFPFIRYPLNPPGVGDEVTLVSRQGYQLLFFVLSAAGIVGLLLAINRINSLTASIYRRARLYGVALLAYGALALVMVFLIPANPDPVEVDVNLLALFRTLTMVGHFLLWALLAAGVALAVTWHQRTAREPAAARGRAARAPIGR